MSPRSSLNSVGLDNRNSENTKSTSSSTESSPKRLSRIEELKLLDMQRFQDGLQEGPTSIVLGAISPIGPISTINYYALDVSPLNSSKQHEHPSPSDKQVSLIQQLLEDEKSVKSLVAHDQNSKSSSNNNYLFHKAPKHNNNNSSGMLISDKSEKISPRIHKEPLRSSPLGGQLIRTMKQ